MKSLVVTKAFHRVIQEVINRLVKSSVVIQNILKYVMEILWKAKKKEIPLSLLTVKDIIVFFNNLAVTIIFLAFSNKTKIPCYHGDFF